jgi:hypothetical protein
MFADEYVTDPVLKIIVRKDIADEISKLATRRRKPFYQTVRECLVLGMRQMEESEKYGKEEI